jgi:hypothetical protein
MKHYLCQQNKYMNLKIISYDFFCKAMAVEKTDTLSSEGFAREVTNNFLL